MPSVFAFETQRNVNAENDGFFYFDQGPSPPNEGHGNDTSSTEIKPLGV